MKNFLSLLIFIILSGLGLFLASHKPLWNDEIFTQVSTINQPYTDILLGRGISEGNKAPLFYVQQKIFCDIFHFQTPKPWLEGHWGYVSPFANIFLRALPVFWMSLFFLLLFRYFSSRFNVLFGFFALFVALSSPFLWRYWPEARPYGWWVLLTGCQMILFLETLETQAAVYKKWLALSLVHIALSLTCVLSFFQIAIVSAVLLAKERRWHQYILLLAVPMVFIFYYRPHSPSNDVIFVLSVEQMVRDNIARQRLYILLIYPLMLGLYYLQNKKLLPGIFQNDALVRVSPFFLSIFLMIMVTVLFLINLKIHATGRGQYVVSRHIIFLSPIGIIGVAYLTGLLWQSLKNGHWLKPLTMAVIVVLLLVRINKGF